MAAKLNYLINQKSMLMTLFFCYNLQIITSGLYSTVRWLFSRIFHKIVIPQTTNHLLIPKIQTFLRKNSRGGVEVVTDDGHNTIKSGLMLTFNPFSVVNVKFNSSACVTDRIEIYLHRLGQDPFRFVRYLDSLTNSQNTIHINTLSSANGWQVVKSIPGSSPILLYPDALIQQVHNTVNKFLSSRDEYQRLGKTYKLTMLFYGCYGSGKTTLVKHLAIKYSRDVYLVDHQYFNGMEDSQKMLSRILTQCQNGILVIEDVDLMFTNDQSVGNSKISAFLNLLDGLFSPENIIIILTANIYGNIPSAISRDGRIDNIINFPYIDDEILSKACQLYSIDPNLVKCSGNLSTSELIKKLEASMDDLKAGRSINIMKESTPEMATSEEIDHRSLDSMSMIEN